MSVSHILGLNPAGKKVEKVAIDSLPTGTVANDSVTNAKAANMASGTIKGRASAGAGDPEDLTAAQARAILNVADGATANSTDAVLKNRANHTGTQLASTISDFAEAVDDRTAALLTAGNNVTITYNDATGQIVVDASAVASGNFNPGGTGAVQRAQDVKLRELGVSVLDYGADPTGVAASDTAFTNAANAAATYGMRTVYIPAGTYRLNAQWYMDKPLRWIGAGRDLTIINSYYTADHAVELVGDGGTDFITLESFQIRGMATHGANLHGVRLAFKSRWYSVYVRGFTNDGIWMDTLSGGASGAVFFAHLNDVWSKFNGRDGIRIRAGANACIFTNCDFSSNGSYGLHHLTDGFATYGNVIIGGQCSYNGSYGYYFESGTDVQAYGLYAEQNGCSTPGNNGTAYATTSVDFYIGDNISRSHINIGTLFSSSLTHVRAPSRGLNDGCAVYQGGRRIFSSTSYTVPTESTAVPSVSTANATDLATCITLANQLKSTLNDLLSSLRTGSTIAP